MRPGVRRRSAWAGLTGMLTSVLTVAAGAGLVAVAPSAQALTVSEVYGRPANGVFSLQGHGWGHGRGMSQWGAEGAAKLGKTATQITSFYYPHTSASKIGNPTIRVQLRSNTDHSKVAVYSATGLYAYDLASGTKVPLSTTPSRWRVTVDSAGYHLSSLSSAGWSAPGKAFTGPLQLQGPTFVRLAFPDGSSRDYRGAVRAVRTGTTTVQPLAVMPMESYLLGVVPRESPSSFYAAALQTQAIAARSYSEYERRHAPSTRSYDICDTTQCQVFGGSHSYTSSGTMTNLEPTSTTQAVQATAGVVRADANGPIFAEFSSSNGGWSVDGGLPYLIAQRDDWDGVVPNSVHSWTASLPVSALESHFGEPAGSFRKLAVTERDGNGEWGGRVTAVVLTFVDSSGTTTTVNTTGRGIYNARTWPAYSTGLRSSWFWILPEYASVVSTRSAAPTLVLPPGNPKGVVTAVLKNAGSGAWPTSGLHLALASPAGGADPLVHGSTTPGVFVGNLTTPGSTDVLPGELAKFQLSFDATGLSPGTRTTSYRVQIGRAALFGATVSWSVTIQAAVLTAAPGAAPALVSTTLPAQSGAPPALFADHRTVVVPRNGSTTLRLTSRNTGNVTWPAGSGTTVRLGTSNPRNRTDSLSRGSDWLSANRVSALVASANVAPQQTGTFDLPLHGNAASAGVTTESFEPTWDYEGWLAGDTTTLTVVRVDPAVPHAAVTDLAPATGFTMVNAPTGTATLTVRLRNVGGTAWDVGTDQLGTSSAAPLQSGWPSATRTPALAGNATRPGQAKVYPGEVGVWKVPLSAFGHAAGSYSMTLRPVSPSGFYGPSLTVSTKVVDAVFTASVFAVSKNVLVPHAGTVTASIWVKNTGNTVWPVGGALRSRILTASSPSYTSTWYSRYRPGSLTASYSHPGATTVRPGEIARFDIVLAGNGRAPQSTSERFGISWDGWKVASLAATLPYRVV